MTDVTVGTLRDVRAANSHPDMAARTHISTDLRRECTIPPMVR